MKHFFIAFIILCLASCAREEFMAARSLSTLIKIDYHPGRKNDFRYIYHWSCDQGKITYWTHDSAFLYNVGTHVNLHTKF